MLHEREMAAKLAAQEAKAKRLRRVTARPMPVTLDVPVVPPKPDPKPLTLPDPFELKSMVRIGGKHIASSTVYYCSAQNEIAPVTYRCTTYAEAVNADPPPGWATNGVCRTAMRSMSSSTGPSCSRRKRQHGGRQSSRCVEWRCEDCRQQLLKTYCEDAGIKLQSAHPLLHLSTCNFRAQFEHACFVLQARPVKAGGPFVVHESDAPLTVPEEPQLLVDSRAVERAEFDAHMAAKMQQEEVSHTECQPVTQPLAVEQCLAGLHAQNSIHIN